MNKDKFQKAISKVLEEGKGKRKFTQTVEFIANFRGINFKRPENRINLDIVLPKGRGKDVQIIVFTDTPQLALEAKNEGAIVMSGTDIPEMAKDKNKLKSLAKKSEFLAEPKLMVVVGKHLGRYLGAMGKLPKPLVGDVKLQIELAKKRTRLATRGKHLPVAQCAIGSEKMTDDDLADNAETVYEKLLSKVPSDTNIKNLYVKLTMGKVMKVE